MNGRSVRNAFKCEAWANAARKNKENDEEKEKTNKNIRGEEEEEQQQPKSDLQNKRKKRTGSCRESYMISMRELSCVESRAGSSFPGSSISKSVMHSQSCQRRKLDECSRCKGR